MFRIIFDLRETEVKFGMLKQTKILQDEANPVFGGKKLVFKPECPVGEQHIVYRPRDTIFGYCAWPSVCCDENGVLYATSSAFGTEHMCPFGKVAMYVSRDGGRKWSPPIIVVDTYLPDGSGGILYLGNGRLLLSWSYHPGDVIYNDYYERIRGTLSGCAPDTYGLLRGSMMDLYPELPPEKLVGGSFVKISDDYGVTWSEAIRLPVAAPHGPTVCRDGTLIYLGKGWYEDPTETLERFSANGNARSSITAENYESWIRKMEESRIGRDCGNTPVSVIASTDGGRTWEKRGVCEKPEWMRAADTSEPHVTELADGTLLGAIRVESEACFANDFTVFFSRSTDGGCSWSPWEESHIAGSPPHLLQHSSGVLICSVGRRAGETLGEYALISHDGGRSWDNELLLSNPSPNDDLGYPATAELPDGSLVTVYYQKFVDPESGVPDVKPCIHCTSWQLPTC